MSINRLGSAFAAIAIGLASLTGCSTSPKAHNQESFISEAEAAAKWFERQVPGLSQQIDRSAGYIIYPEVGQWGIIFAGGEFGRGMVNRPDDSQIGWGAINIASVGLQAGVRGFKMLVVIEDHATLARFMQNRLTGSVSGVVVVGEEGAAGTAKFENGVAVYQAAGAGLMAGVNIGLEYMRYKPLEDSE